MRDDSEYTGSIAVTADDCVADGERTCTRAGGTIQRGAGVAEQSGADGAIVNAVFDVTVTPQGGDSCISAVEITYVRRQ